MLINDTSKMTKLTKKAIEYYTEQDLVFPKILENGYRDFNHNDIERLKKIFVLRKLGLSIEEMKIVLADNGGDALKKLSIQKELSVQRQRIKNEIINKLSSGKSYEEISTELEAMEQSAAITEKLLDAFPGYYGRYICLHFARFLSSPIFTEEEKMAYNTVLEFLDNLPPLNLPKDLQAFLIEGTDHITTENIKKLLEDVTISYDEPDKFFSEKKEAIEDYISFMQSEEYISSPMYQLSLYFKEFNKQNGYYDIFIPAMRILSHSYDEYLKKAELVNDKLLAQYPKIKEIGK